MSSFFDVQVKYLRYHLGVAHHARGMCAVLSAVSPSGEIFVLDEIIRGVDSSTSLEDFAVQVQKDWHHTVEVQVGPPSRMLRSLRPRRLIWLYYQIKNSNLAIAPHCIAVDEAISEFDYSVDHPGESILAALTWGLAPYYLEKELSNE